MGPGEGEDDDALTLVAISVQAEAEAELLDAFWYYESRGTGLGAEFRYAVDASSS